MSKFIVLSAPRSGTHMLVRMISRSQKIPWKVPMQAHQILGIKEKEWVIGVHEKYENVIKFCSEDIKIICIKRINGHKESLKNFNEARHLEFDLIINSFPEHLTVIYDEIVKPSKTEINKIKKILDIDDIEYEPWEKRYDSFPGWRIRQHYDLL